MPRGAAPRAPRGRARAAVALGLGRSAARADRLRNRLSAPSESGTAAGVHQHPRVEGDEAGDGRDGEDEVGDAGYLLAVQRGAAPEPGPERFADETNRVVVEGRHAEEVHQDVIAVHLEEAEGIEAHEERL